MPHGRAFLSFAKFGTLQYSVIKPVGAFVALVLAPFGLYHEVRRGVCSGRTVLGWKCSQPQKR